MPLRPRSGASTTKGTKSDSENCEKPARSANTSRRNSVDAEEKTPTTGNSTDKYLEEERVNGQNTPWEGPPLSPPTPRKSSISALTPPTRSPPLSPKRATVSVSNLPREHPPGWEEKPNLANVTSEASPLGTPRQPLVPQRDYEQFIAFLESFKGQSALDFLQGAHALTQLTHQLQQTLVAADSHLSQLAYQVRTFSYFGPDDPQIPDLEDNILAGDPRQIVRPPPRDV